MTPVVWVLLSEGGQLPHFHAAFTDPQVAADVAAIIAADRYNYGHYWLQEVGCAQWVTHPIVGS